MLLKGCRWQQRKIDVMVARPGSQVMATLIAIDTYLSAKGTNGPSRAQLLEHMRKGTRWYTLAGPHLNTALLTTVIRDGYNLNPELIG